MKKLIYIFLFCLSFQSICKATNYYYKGSGTLTNTSSWGLNTDGSGTNPTNFTTASQVFFIQNTSSISITANWTVSGASSFIQLGDGTNSCTFTIPNNYTVTGTIAVSNAATLVNQNIATPTLGTLSTGSTILFSGTTTQTIPSTTYSNLSVTNTGAVVSAGGAITVNNIFTIGDGATVNMGTSAFTCGSSMTTSNNSGTGTGILMTKALGSGAITTNSIVYTWYFTLEFAGTTGTQSTAKGGQIYSSLIFANTSGVTLYNSSTITTQLIILDGCYFNCLTNSFSGTFTTSNGGGSGTGKLITQNITSTPFPAKVTYNFEVDYNSTSAQTIVAGNYTILNASNTGTAARTLGTGTIAISSSFIPGNTGTYSVASADTLSLAYTNTLFSTLGTNNANLNNLTITSGITTAPNSLTITGSFTISGGNFIAPSTNFNVGGNWNNLGGVYTHNNGTVTLNGTNQILTGSTSFYNFIKSVSSASTLTLPAGQTQIFAGSLSLNGTTGNLLTIASSTTSQASINPSGSVSLNFVQLTYCKNVNGANIIATNANENGNNNGFTFYNGCAWTGTSSTNWNDANNWIPNGIPASTANVVIAKTSSNELSIETSPTVASLTIYANNNVTLQNSQTLTLNGNLVNAGSLNAVSSSTIVIGGSCTISGIGTNQFNHLAINSGKTLTGGTINISGNFINNGTYSASGGTVILNGTTAQTIPTATYSTLSITNTNAIVSATGSITISTNININASATLDLGVNQLLFSGSPSTTGSGTLNTQNTSASPFPASKTWSFAINFYNSTGGQTIPYSSVFNGLTISNTSGTINAGGNITINGNLALTYSGSSLVMGTSSLICGTAFSTSGIGELSTQSVVGSSAINTNSIARTFNFTVLFNATTAAQTLPQQNNSFNNLQIANTYGVGAYGNYTISGTLTINSGCALNMGGYALSGNFTTSGSGIITTGNTSTSPFTSGLTYSFEVDYNSSSSQTIVVGTYSNLNATGGNRVFGTSDTIIVNGTFTAGSGSYTTTNSTLYLSQSTTLPSISFNNLVVAGGIITSPSSLTINGNLTINLGVTFTAPSSTLNIAGNWTNNGTFNHNNGTVVFNGTRQYIYGSSTFKNLSKSVISTDVFTFQSGSTQTIAGTLTLNGTSGNLLYVYSSIISSQANINPTSSRAISYVAVSGSNNISGTTISTSNSINEGNNTNWTLSSPSATGDLETVPSTWSCVNGWLSADTNHYRLGSRSVAWNWNANDTLKITGIGFDSTYLFNYNYNTMGVSLYNTVSTNDSVQFIFYDRYNKVRYYFSVHLNYKGWYETIRSYRYNMFIPVGTPAAPDSLMKVYIVAPHSGNGQLNFDNVNWIKSRTSTPMTLPMPDNIIKSSGGYPPYDANTIYNLSPNIGLSIPSAADISDYQAVKSSYLSDLQSSALLIATESKLTAANTFFNSNGYQLNNDGTAKGKAYFAYPQDAGGRFSSFTQNLQIFAYSWLINNSDTVSLNKAIIMLRFLLDNGNFAAGCYKIGPYDALEFYTSVAALSDKIYSTDTSLYNSLANYVRWQNNFGAAWMPSSVYSPLYTDNVREEITGYLAYPLFLIRDTATAIQNLKGFRQLIANFMIPNDGNEDNVKVDGSAFHHLSNYYNYVEPCYASLSKWLYHLRNTQFKPDSVTYKRIRDVVYTYFLQENTFSTTYGNKGESQQSSFLTNPSSLSRLAILGNGIVGAGPDNQIAAAYNRLFPNISDPSIPVSSFPAEPYPSGFTQLNYATMGIYRQNNWLSTIKMLSPDYWGVQCGLVGDNGQRRDVFSRYLGYGSIDVQYANGLDSSGYTFDNYKYDNGYDHRFPNGATTIVLNLDSMAVNENYGFEYANSGSIAGSLSFNNRIKNFSFKTRGDYGLSAMNFKQAPYGFNGGCRGGGRDTSFKFQKSWFAFDSIIVCLGSGITNKNNASKTQTNIFQLTDSAQTMYINGVANNTFNYSNNFYRTGPYQLISPYGTGYYVVSNDSLHISVSKQQFSLNVNGTYVNSAGNWANVWLDHGSSPTNKSYQYTILPSTNSTALSHFADSMASPASAFYTIKEQDSLMHRVYYKPKNILGYAIFKPVTNISDTTSFIKSVDNPCYAMGINQGDSLLSLTIVNPNPNLQETNIQSSVLLGSYVSKSVEMPLTITLRGSWAFVSSDTSMHIVNTTDSSTQILINTQYALPNDAVFYRLKVPSAPVIDSVKSGNQQVTVYFEVPENNGGAAITNYTVTPYINGVAQTKTSGTSSPITVTGLTNGTAYTFTVYATNLVGNSIASVPSSAVTPVTVPGIPTMNSVTGGNQHVIVSFTPPVSNGGTAISSYTVTTYMGGVAQFTTNTSASPVTISSLTNGTIYTFTVYATNSVGNSLSSAASSSVTPSNNYFWTGGSSTNWNDANNWSPLGIPPATAVVTISKSGAYDLSIETSPTVASLIINAGNNVVLQNGQMITLNGNFTNNGTLTANATSTVVIATSATLSGSGTSNFNNITINSGQTLTGGNMAVSGSFTNNGTFIASTGTVNFNGTATQTIPALTYYNLSVTNVSSAVNASGAITLTSGGTLTITSSAILDMGNYQLLAGTTLNTSGLGKLKTAFVSGTNPAIPLNKIYSFAVNYYTSTGGQYFGGTYNNGVTFSNTSGTNTASGNMYVSGILNISNTASIINMQSNVVQGSITQTTVSSGTDMATNSYIVNMGAANPNIINGMSVNGPNIPIGTTVVSGGGTAALTLSNYPTSNVSNSALTLTFNFATSGTGTLRTQYAFSNAVPPASYTFTVEYNGSSSSQTLPNGISAFTNLTNSNAVAGDSVVLFGNISVSGLLTIANGATLKTGSYSVSGNFTTSGTGTLVTACTAATPLTVGSTYTFAVIYSSTSAQTIVAGKYSTLNAANTGAGARTLAAGTVAVSSSFVPGNTGIYTVNANDTVSFGGTLSIPASVGTNTANFSNIAITAGTVTAPNTMTISGSFNLSGGTFVAPSGNFTVAGNWNTTNGTYSANGGTVILNGAAAQTINGNGIVGNLSVNNSAGVSISSGNNKLCVSGMMALVNGQLTTNSNLIFKSDSSSTGSLAPYGINGNNGSLNGTVTVQRFIQAKIARKYSFIGSPINQSIHNTWQQQIYITGAGTGGTACGSTNGNGVLATDKYNGNGFDATQFNYPSMFTYAASPVNGSRWVTIPNTISNNLTPGIGYRVNIRGDRNSATVSCSNQLNSTTPSAPESVTLSATGNMNTGDIAVALNNPATHPYTLLANPYPCPISFTALQSSNSNTYNKMWTYSPLGNGNYTTYSAGVIANGASGYDNVSGDYIASGQAFFVQSNAAGNITFHESHKVNNTPPNTKYFGVNANPLIRVGLTDTSNNLLDEVVVRFHRQGSMSYNQDWDALSFSGSSQTLAVLKGQNSLAIASMPDSLINDTVPIAISSTHNGVFNIKLSDFEEIDTSVSLYLKDNFLSTIQNVRANKLVQFSVTADSNSQGRNRFEIILKRNATLLSLNKMVVVATVLGNNVEIKWTTTSNNQASYEIEKSVDGINFITIGKTNSTTFIDSLSFVPTTYYRVKAINSEGTITYSNTYKLTTNHSQLTTIYPNPLTGNTLSVQLENWVAGKYKVSVVNVLGQKVVEQRISYVSGIYKFALNMDKMLASNRYTVIIKDENTGQVVFQTALSVLH